MNTNKLKELKELLDMGAISTEEFEFEKNKIINEEKSKKSKNVGLIITIIIVIFICLAIIAGINTENEDSTAVSQTNIESSVPEEYMQPCPVAISSSMSDNIIGVPEIKCVFNNKTETEIAAIKLYFCPKDVYGEEINTIFTTKELYTDNPIAAGSSSSRVWQLLDTNVRSGDIYVYSVYFSDGTEWGNKNAPVSEIKKYAYKISTKY